jgi:excisionase family DNA binding protein
LDKHSQRSTSESEYFSIKEFANKLGVHPNTIRRAIKSGRICGFKVGSGKRSIYRISKDEITRVRHFDMEEMIEKIINQRKTLES